MIGDHVRLLDLVRDSKTLQIAFKYALYDRVNVDYYYDCFELEFVVTNRRSIIAEISRELVDTGSYKPRPAYAYYPPKNDLCYRRMIYIPFKDLVVRYAFAIVLADMLDGDMSTKCFANRRAHGDRAKVAFLEDFARASWPNFCRWQRDCASRDGFTTLLRTDISAFYDSVSHDYLVETIAGELAVEADTDLLSLFKNLLRVPVISYSHLSCRPKPKEILRQGLAIGNTPDAFFANLYLKGADEAMQQVSGVEFGRYNDDMRIFAGGRRQAQGAVLALQEHLLAKGLNLNAAKTEIAEGPQKIEELRSKAYEAYDYFPSEEDVSEMPTTPEKLDQPFETFSRKFAPGEEFTDPKDAKEFCQFMSHRRENQFDLLPIEDRRPGHVAKLEDILTRWHGSSKHAAWLLVESAFDAQCPKETQQQALETLLRCLAHEDVATYAKYRLLHHLAKQRRVRGSQSRLRYLDRGNKSVRDKLYELMPHFLRKPAFELNIIAMYTLMALGSSPTDLEAYVQQYAPKPLGTPIKNALLSLVESTGGAAPFDFADEEESDAKPDYH